MIKCCLACHVRFIISVPVCRYWFADVFERRICVMHKCFLLRDAISCCLCLFRIYPWDLKLLFALEPMFISHIFRHHWLNYLLLQYRCFSLFLFVFPFSTSLWDGSFERESNSLSDYWGSRLLSRGPSPSLYFFTPFFSFLLFLLVFVAPYQAL